MTHLIRRTCGPTVPLWMMLLASQAGVGCDASQSLQPTGGNLARLETSGYELDDTLRMNQLQAEGTHNSYHVMTLPIPPWHYTHAPLDQQLNDQGVRNVELDVHFVKPSDSLPVFHVPIIDAGSTCPDFETCLGVIKGWSDAHPGHHPLFIHLEPKDGIGSKDVEAYAQRIVDGIYSVFPEDRIITPDYVQGSAPSLRDAIQTTGWPTLGETRGMVLFYLDDAGDIRDVYTHGGESLSGVPLFVDSDQQDSFAAMMVINDPTTDFEAIQSAVLSGFIVRTRADTDGEEARDGDYSRFELALSSGAQIISTDFPAPTDDVDYYIEIPDGTPSRCNPLTAPADCYPEAIEDPELL